MFTLLLLGCALAPAQEDAEFTPPPKRPGVQITFIPPPLNGTLSLGIFNKAGKLVRTLHREAKTKEFVVGLNGLMTWWDGKTDAGGVASPGNYSVRGFAVGGVEFQGEAFHFNDWIVDEKSPRIRRILPSGDFSGFTGVDLSVELANGKSGRLNFVPNPEAAKQTLVVESEQIAPKSAEGIANEATESKEMGLPSDLNWFIEGDEGFAFGDGKLWRKIADRQWEPVKWNGLEQVVWACYGQKSVWVIDDSSSGTEVKEYAFDGEVLRHLATVPDEPVPRRIDAKGSEEIFLFEEGKGCQRVRILWKESSTAQSGDGTSVSTWKTVASKTIRSSDKLADVQADLKTEAGEAFAGVEKITVRLLPNQLVQNKITSVDVGVAVDAKGSFLRTADGLPLKRITETPGLKWVAMMKESGGKGVTIFQSDGAVVEEFKAKKLASMMAFDAGDYEWRGKVE